MTRTRRHLLRVLALLGLAIAPSARAESPSLTETAPARLWLVEPRAFAGGAATTGEASRLYGAAPDVGLGVALRRSDTRVQWRASIDLQRPLDLGGASLMTLRCNFGAALTWREHIVTALEAGPIARRTAVGDEVSKVVFGGSLVAEVGWRFRPSPRWSLTPSARASAAFFVSDEFLWRDVAAFLTIEREGAPPR